MTKEILESRKLILEKRINIAKSIIATTARNVEACQEEINDSVNELDDLIIVGSKAAEVLFNSQQDLDETNRLLEADATTVIDSDGIINTSGFSITLVTEVELC